MRKLRLMLVRIMLIKLQIDDDFWEVIMYYDAIDDVRLCNLHIE